MQIKAHITIYHSKIDRNGNTYWAFTYTDNMTGKSASGTVCGGESNVLQLRNGPDGWDEGITYHVDRLPIREFNRLVKGWKHAGCTGEELRTFVANELAKPE